MTLLLAILLAPLILLTFCFAVEVFAGIRPSRSGELRPSAISSAVVVPAHNEAEILRERLEALQIAIDGRSRLIVVADNCDDSTAGIGRELGAEVVERFDAVQRGKGFALDCARKYLASDPPEVVAIIDADCWTDPRSLQRLIDYCGMFQRPCQAIYLQAPAGRGQTAVQLSTFAFFIKNLIRQRGLQRLSGRALLVGSGMAFPWAIFARADLATSNIVEDLKLGLELAREGCPPMLIEEAVVWGPAETAKNTLSQRRRWEGGFMEIASRTAPSLLGNGIARLDRRDIWAAISLMIPPLALLVGLDVAALGVSGVLAFLAGAGGWPVLLLAAALLIALISVAFAWLAGGRKFVPMTSLLRAPIYVLWKIPLYIGLAARGAPKEWLRTHRGNH